MIRSHFILYVSDQARSTEFYAAVLAAAPSLNVPGMTEFELGIDTVLGLMPEKGAIQLLGQEVFSSAGSRPNPRAELYLVVEDATPYHARALAAGGREISPMQERDWGDVAAYSLDLDGNVLAFASPKDR